MAHVAQTPESLLPRSDSRNAATTCRGITVHGRPCRRALASLSIPRQTQARHETADPAAFYCWQHKDQAGPLTPWVSVDSSNKPRSSIDTLLDRLGVLEISGDQSVQKQKPHRRRLRPANNAEVREKRRPAAKRTFCCFEIVEDDSEDYTPPKPVPRPVQRPVQVCSAHAPFPAPQILHNGSQRPSSGGHTRAASSSAASGYHSRPSSRPRASSLPQTPSRPSTAHTRKSSSSSHTQSLLAWIPPMLEPQTTSLLLAELAKPISAADEQGYIYMFWVMPPTPASAYSNQLSPTEIAPSLLPPSSSSRDPIRPPIQPRSVSDALRAAQNLNALTQNPTPGKPGTIRLKIGRTSNVHRRLTQWTRQCSHDLTLIRYYPYTPSSAPRQRNNRKYSAPDLFPGRKVPHVHRVERLIHLELAGLRARDLGRCGECGKEHREWFEVEAATEALRRVDECVRRWVAWGETV